MKKLFIILAVLIILASTAAPALAASGPNRAAAGVGRGAGPRAAYFSLAGVVTAIDDETHSVTVLVMAGNRLVHPYLGEELVISTNDGTRFLLRTEDGCVPITFDDLEVDQNVSVRGQVFEEAWQALRITVGAELPRMQP